jgi:DNA-binding IclR family transcriptional regulator
MTGSNNAKEPLQGRSVPALVRAKRIMDALSSGGAARGVTDLATELGLAKSTVHGLCHTLAELGLLVRTGQSQFGIGPHALVWANAYQSESTLPQAFMELAGQGPVRKESINLSVPTGREVMYIACKQGSDPLGVSFRPGLRLPAPLTATGKAILSTMPDETIHSLFANDFPAPWTAASVASVDDLLVEMAETRERGYSIENGQLREAMVCLGAPVFGASSTHAIAGVAIGVLAGEADDTVLAEIAATVRRLSAELSQRLGGRSG